eukprot:Nitzschia sp. Nitz4//scaffold127_size64804//35553//35915//NITZ4_006179-RA/size64804-processed-gene-0.80-mRNA-1//-1//CDS//3329534759//6482//frame0
MAACRKETERYRQCLKDSKQRGVNGSKNCKSLALSLESCREKWRKANHREHNFDGTRIVPNKKCLPFNSKVQRCLKWKKGDETQCREDIQALKTCMDTEKGVLAAPTEGDKVWSDYKGPK